MKPLAIVALFALTSLGSCGGSKRIRVHDKESTVSDIKISHLDVGTGDLALRLSYRSNTPTVLENIECSIGFNNKSTLSFSKIMKLDLGAYSTEVLTFKNNPIKYSIKQDQNTINYKLNCVLTYQKGKEHVIEESILHTVPSSHNQYR